MIRAWHFIKGNKLRDGTTAPKDGDWLKYAGAPVMCDRGLHASIRAFDALQYAPGETLCLVDCAGVVIHSDDKLVCTERRIVTRMDATPLLRYFARQQALSVVHLYPGEPAQCVLDFLMGDDAARDAAWDAAWAAARDAAWDAAWAAARAAAWAAARDAAVGSVRRAAARAAAGDDFAALVNDAFEDWL